MSHDQRESRELILTKDNKPFKTPASANLVMTNMVGRGVIAPQDFQLMEYKVGDEEGYAIVRKGSQTCIRLEESGMEVKETAVDPTKRVIKQDERKSEEGLTPAGLPLKGYSVVVFHEKPHQDLQNDVILGHNTEVMQCQRGQEVVIPNRYLRVADDGVFKKFKIIPGQDRQVSHTIQHYPYTRIREASKEEYDEFVAVMRDLRRAG